MRRLAVGLLFAATSLITFAGHPEIQLDSARTLLTGSQKDTRSARTLLLEVVRNPKHQAAPETLACAYLYLGYVEDRAGNRQRAIEWFRKVTAVEGASKGIVDVARAGLARPITFIRHLDASSQPSPSPAPSTPRPAKAYVAQDPPAGMTLATKLTPEQRRDNFEALWRAIDTTYAHFNLKSIDWEAIGRRYRGRLDSIQSDEDFYLLLFQLVNELQDTHSSLQDYRPPRLFEPTDLLIDTFEQRPFVVAVRPGSEPAEAGIAPGWEILSVDGLTPAAKMESLRPHLRALSSPRAFHRSAGQRLLAADDATPATVEFRSPAGETKSLTLPRTVGRRIRPPARQIGFELTRQRFVHFGRHPSGLGYIQIASFNGRKDIADEFDRALAELRRTPGLLLDIRDNPGGFGQPWIVGRLLKKRAVTGISYTKSGSRHSDLNRHKLHLDPTGAWQYTRPIALLVNDATGSAADLFACELRSAGRVVTVGAPTHGNLSGVAAFVVLPCGLVVRVSNGYVADAQDRPIEVAGNIPDTIVEPTVKDFLAGKDPVIDAAASIILKESATGAKASRP